MRVPGKLKKPASGSSKLSNQSSISNSSSESSVDSSSNEGVNTNRNTSTDNRAIEVARSSSQPNAHSPPRDNRGVGVSTNNNTTATEVARSSSQPNAHSSPRDYRGVGVSTNNNTTATEVARSSSQPPNAHYPPRGYQMKRASTQSYHTGPMNQFFDHRSSTWSSSRDTCNFAKKHHSYNASSRRYKEPCSLSEKYTNYLKNNPGCTLSPEEFGNLGTAVSVSFNEPVRVPIKYTNRKKYKMQGVYVWKNVILPHNEPRIFFNKQIRQIYMSI